MVESEDVHTHTHTHRHTDMIEIGSPEYKRLRRNNIHIPMPAKMPAKMPANMPAKMSLFLTFQKMTPPEAENFELFQPIYSQGCSLAIPNRI